MNHILKKPLMFMLVCTLIFAAGCSGRVTVTADVSSPAQEASPETDNEETGQEPVPLKDVVASEEGLGEDAIFGACIGHVGAADKALMDLAFFHFNAVTIENELKPEALFGYSKASPAPGSIHEEEVAGVVTEVPTLDHSHADAILDMICDHNEKNPDDVIKVRGHVLVWHSQTPEWFFHEGYDTSKDYVCAEEMNRRLEWYIKSVLEYYTGSGSKYKDLFYGWDVVNEAVSDRSGTYRTDTEPGGGSPWWKVYGSNEYIIKAFEYANTYAPEDLELYYNDYNECNAAKRKGILNLIEDVKASERARIDGFGMQGHYTVNAPPAADIDKAVREYADAVGKVMVTELDVKPSMFYDGTKESLPKENMRQAKYYAQVYEALKQLKKEGYDIRGITLWGVSDRYTWLEGKHPLLFDEDYAPKPAYWAFADPERLSDEDE